MLNGAIGLIAGERVGIALGRLFAENLLQKTARAAGWVRAEMSEAGLAAGGPYLQRHPPSRGVRLAAEPAIGSRPGQTGEIGLARCGH